MRPDSTSGRTDPRALKQQQRREHSSRPWRLSLRWGVLSSIAFGGLFCYAAYGWSINSNVQTYLDDAIGQQRQAISQRLVQEELEQERSDREERLKELQREDDRAERRRQRWVSAISLSRLPSEYASHVVTPETHTQNVTFTPSTVVTDDDTDFWSFQPANRPKPPTVQPDDWSRNPIDQFVLVKLEDEGLTPNHDADSHVLCRRLWFDLIGRPPTPEELESFHLDGKPFAYEQLVNRLLANPGFGERWARVWLDLARYADSNGYEEDELRPYAFPYRDFVVWAMNHDLPFDDFIRWQIAGDQLGLENPMAVAATGFFTAAPYNTFFPQETERFDELDDMVATMTSSMLGLSVGCARCHDHKYDPIPTRDYYGLVAVFFDTQRERSILLPDGGREYRQWSDPIDTRRAEIKEIRRASVKEENIAELDYFTEEEKDLLRQPVDPNNKVQERLISLCERCLLITEDHLDDDVEPLPQDKERHDQLVAEIEELKLLLPPRPPFGLTLGGGAVSTSPVLEGGDIKRKQGEVGPGFLTAVTSGRPVWDKNAWKAWADTNSDESSNTPRKSLAHWMTDVERGPGVLLARVIVNRLWQHHFGQGLVRTPNDFGMQGDLPSHPQLLEWLTCELIENNWSLKHIHRLIVTSSTYRQAAGANEQKINADPDNRLLGRRRPQRITAEMLWDAVHASGGNLTDVMYGPGIKPPITREAVFNTQDEVEDTWPTQTDEDRETLWRRGIYVMLKRTIPLPIMQLFDAPVGTFACGKRKITTVPTQALALWHSDLLRRQAKRTAERAIREIEPVKDDNIRLKSIVERVYLITLSRKPDSDETSTALAFLQQHGGRNNPTQRLNNLTDFCQVMFLTNEFIYVD